MTSIRESQILILVALQRQHEVIRLSSGETLNSQPPSILHLSILLPLSRVSFNFCSVEALRYCWELFLF